MNKKLSMAMGMVLTSASLVGFSSAASAEDMGLEFSANVAMTTDYVFRGISQTNNDPAIQGGFDVAHSSGIYAGVWGSNVSGYAGASMELDTYIGWAGEVGPVGVDVGFLNYGYPGDTTGSNPTDEWHIGVSGNVGDVALGLTYNYSDEFYGTSSADYWDFSAEVPVGDFSLAAHYGITNYDSAGSANDYDDWSIGASTEFGGFGFGLTYSNTDISPSTSNNDDIWAFSISKSM